MTPFQIWWCGVPVFVPYCYWVAGKMIRQLYHMDIPVVRGGASFLMALLWPMVVVFDIIPALARWLHDFTLSFYYNVIVDRRSVREWWKKLEFRVTVAGKE